MVHSCEECLHGCRTEVCMKKSVPQSELAGNMC